jgi:NADPH:quinone reductase-like Zn-dependent oxidoreductase
MRFLVTGLLVLLAAASLVCRAQTPNPEASAIDAPKAVLVTGASTGIGRKITEHLASRGYFVYAGARKQADLDA